MSKILLGIETAFENCSSECKYIQIEPSLIVPVKSGTKYRCRNMNICLHAAEMERQRDAKEND